VGTRGVRFLTGFEEQFRANAYLCDGGAVEKMGTRCCTVEEASSASRSIGLAASGSSRPRSRSRCISRSNLVVSKKSMRVTVKRDVLDQRSATRGASATARGGARSSPAALVVASQVRSLGYWAISAPDFRSS
jgi:hypothetical protein